MLLYIHKIQKHIDKMETILILANVAIGIIVGLILGHMLWYHPCNHTWVLLETHKETRNWPDGTKQETIKSVYTCNLCGKTKTLNF